MTKRELLARMNELLAQKGMTRIDGGNGAIGMNETKGMIQNAINCLETSDDIMRDYLTVIKLKYPGTYNVIANNGDFLTHYHNRLYVYNTARMALA